MWPSEFTFIIRRSVSESARLARRVVTLRARGCHLDLHPLRPPCNQWFNSKDYTHRHVCDRKKSPTSLLQNMFIWPQQRYRLTRVTTISQVLLLHGRGRRADYLITIMFIKLTLTLTLNSTPILGVSGACTLCWYTYKQFSRDLCYVLDILKLLLLICY